MTAPQSAAAPRSVPLWAQAIGYALLAVFFAALGFSGFWTVFRIVPEYSPVWSSLLTGLPAAALALTKQRAPLAGCLGAVVLVLVDLLFVGGLVPFIVLLDLVYTLTVALPARARRRVLVAVAIATAAVAVFTMVVGGDLRVTVVIGLQFGALFGTTYWYGTAVAQSRELVELHRRQADDARRLAELDREAAVLGERERMASELHDIIAGHVAAVAIRSEAALAAVPAEAGQPEGATASGAVPGASAERAALRAVRDSSLEAHEALRAMIGVLRGGSGETAAAPGVDRIPAMIEGARRSGVSVELDDRIAGSELPDAVDRATWRIVNEALVNAVKHASGSEVDVVLVAEGGAARVDVVSRGGAPIARPVLRGGGMGLEMLAERVRALGGEFDAGPIAGGWAVRARIPMEARA